MDYGESHNIKRYRLFDISNHYLFTSHDVIFHEDSLLHGRASSSTPSLLIFDSDIDYLVHNYLLTSTINLKSSQSDQIESWSLVSN